ncbi:hypothetical protein C8R44DRAFT_720942 [Mycena epipterygia]|nr:hypothetical protein C8R44DRAFT_720942 [Mycena epipterygia]
MAQARTSSVAFSLLSSTPLFNCARLAVKMALLRCRAFLGCVPLRTAVWLLALIAMMVSGPGAGGSWLEMYWTENHPISLRDKMAILARAVVFSSLFLLSILGFIAALQGARGAVYIYSKFIFIHTPVILLSFGLTLFATLQPDNSDPDGPTKCLNGSSSPIIAQFCSHSMTFIRILPIAFLGAASLIQFNTWIVSISYAEELDLAAAPREFSKKKYYGSDSDLEANARSMYPEPPFGARR